MQGTAPSCPPAGFSSSAGSHPLLRASAWPGPWDWTPPRGSRVSLPLLISFSIRKVFITFQASEPLKFPFKEKCVSKDGFSVNRCTIVTDATWGWGLVSRAGWPLALSIRGYKGPHSACAASSATRAAFSVLGLYSSHAFPISWPLGGSSRELEGRGWAKWV